MTEHVETVVIGAGQAGLSTSYHLTSRGREHVVLERGRVGETWRSERWDGFVLNTPNWGQQLPGFHYDGPEPDAFAPRHEVIDYLDGYARSFAAPVREGVEVRRVRQGATGFVVEADGEEWTAGNVVVAAGAYQRPTRNALAEALPDTVLQLHTSAYKRPDQLPDGPVLIVGSGQSGCQIADELLGAGRAVYMSVGRCPWFPRRYRDRELLHWLLETGLADDTVDTLPSPAARLTCNPPVSGNDGGHDCNPRWLARRGAVLVGRLEDVDGATVRVGLAGLRDSLAAGDEFVASFKRRVDDHGRAHGLELPPPEADEEPPPLPEIEALDLDRAGIATVMWANGFRPDHTWIDGLETDEQGWPVHDRGVSTMTGLYFVGLHWLHRRRSALFCGVGADAEHVARHLCDRERRMDTARSRA